LLALRADSDQVDALARVVASVARETAADLVLDVGAGQGHLACALAFQHGLRVVAVDAVGRLSAASAARVARLQRFTRGCASHGCLLATLPARLAWGTSEGCAELDSLLREHAGSAEPRLLLVGLHACGDLTPAILRTFAALSFAVAVVVVPCCHNLLTERGNSPGERRAAEAILQSTAHAGSGCVAETPVSTSDEGCCEHPGYPMSCHASAALGRRARMLACQSGDRWRTLTDDQEKETARCVAAGLSRLSI
jgi:SAM-dependent methyltransferase